MTKHTGYGSGIQFLGDQDGGGGVPPVRLVSAFVEEMDLSELYKTYSRIRKNQATPRQMLKLVIYAVMNRIYSSRDIQKACKRDINFMYLLEGMP